MKKVPKVAFGMTIGRKPSAAELHRTDPVQRRLVAAAVLAVVLLHLALLWLLTSAGRRQDATRADPERITVRLLPMAPQQAPQPTPQPTPQPAPMPPSPRTEPSATPRASRVTRTPAPITAPGPVAATPITLGARPDPVPSLQAEGTPAPALPASQPPPLNLALPPGFATAPTARDSAINDPRANVARIGLGGKMAATLGTDTRVIEEDLGGGRRRFRSGNDCVVVTQARIAQLMPFNDSAARTPSYLGSCR